MNGRGFHFNTIYARSLFFNLILAGCITLIPFTVSINYFISRYNSQINQYNAQMARQAQNYIDDTVIEQIVEMPNTYFSELSSNYELTYPYTNDISGDSVMIQEISTRLKNISAAYGFLDGINLCYTKSNIVFGVSGVAFVNDESFPKAIQGHEQIVQALLQIDRPTEWLTSVTLLGQQDPSPAVFLKVLPYSATLNKQAVLAVGFNPNFFYQFADQMHLGRDETLFILDPAGNIVLSTDRRQNGTKLKDEKMVGQLTGKSESGMLSGSIFGSSSVISYSKSKYNDWRYVSVVTTESYYQKSSQMKLVLLLSLLLLLPLNLALSAFSTQKAHQPLSRVLKLIRGAAGGGTAEKNEYSLLENTFRGLNDKVVELNGRLEENMPIIRHNALLRLLRDDAGRDEQALRALANIRFEGENLFCFILRLFGGRELDLENRLLIAFDLIPMLESLPGMDCKPVIDEGSRLAAIVSFGAGQDTARLLERISAAVGAALTLPYTLCVGGIYPARPENVHLSYAQAAETYDYAFIRCGERLLRYGFQEGQTKNGAIQPKQVHRLEELLKAGEEAAVNECIDVIVAGIQRGSYGIACVRSTLMDMLAIVRMTLIDLGLDETELLGGDIHSAFARQDSILSFAGWLKEVCARIASGLNTRRGTVGKEMEQKISRYIAENIYKDLSLESAADALYLSPGYLSKIFKNVFGMHFTDYVVKAKMEEAVKLLRRNTQTVKEISNSLGYSSVQYFIRIFKERYGYTPKLYQKSLLEHESCHT